MLQCEELTGQIIGAAIRVHSVLGAGLLESTYEKCLAHEIAVLGLSVRRQVMIPIVYDGMRLDAAYSIDLLVEDTVVLELKSIEKVNAIHQAQLLTYLRLSGKPVGLLINFNVPRLRDGITRRVQTR